MESEHAALLMALCPVIPSLILIKPLLKASFLLMKEIAPSRRPFTSTIRELEERHVHFDFIDIALQKAEMRTKALNPTHLFVA